MAFTSAFFGFLGLACLLAPATAVPSSRMAKDDSNLYLQVYEAGKRDGGLGPKLQDGSAICPTMFPGGFSIVCKGVPEGTKLVYLSYNDRYTAVEKYAPYSLTGDMNGAARPLKNAGAGGKVKCWTDTGASVEVQVVIKCEDGSSAPPMDDMESKPPKMTNSEPEDDDDMTSDDTMGDSMGGDDTMGDSMDGDDMMGDSMDGDDMMGDSMDGGETKPKAPKKSPTEEMPPMEKEPPMEKPQMEESSSPNNVASSPPKGTKGNCVVLSALRDTDRLAAGWVRRSNGIVYKPNLGGFKIERVPTSDSVVMRMRFTAPQDSRFAVAMDSTSQHGTEANDLFVRMTSPKLILVKGNQVQSGVFMKAFQSSNGRDPRMRCRADVLLPGGKRHGDSITTGMLKKGEKYEFHIAGRSNKFTLHHIVMWPCSGESCSDTSKVWQDMVTVCRPF